VACRLFDAGKLALWAAAQWAGLRRVEFEGQLLERGIAIYRPTSEDLRAELEAWTGWDSRMTCGGGGFTLQDRSSVRPAIAGL
jgi:hypothetical protein